MGSMGVSRDVTAAKRDREALSESEERYRDLFENATDLIQKRGRWSFPLREPGMEASNGVLGRGVEVLDALGCPGPRRRGTLQADHERPVGRKVHWNVHRVQGQDGRKVRLGALRVSGSRTEGGGHQEHL